MKNFKILFAFIALFFVSTISAQTKTDWKEKTEFHKVMSQTFHPAEEGNYAPIRSRVDEMVTKAIAFQKSEIPADINNKKGVKKSLKKLVKQTKAFSKKVKSGASDADLKGDFEALHDIFHEVVGMCSAEDEHK